MNFQPPTQHLTDFCANMADTSAILPTPTLDALSPELITPIVELIAATDLVAAACLWLANPRFHRLVTDTDLRILVLNPNRCRGCFYNKQVLMGYLWCLWTGSSSTQPDAVDTLVAFLKYSTSTATTIIRCL